MTLRELGYSIQDAFANVGDWFQEMLWVALYGSWFDLTIGQFILLAIPVGIFLYMLGVMVFEIVPGIFKITKNGWKEFFKTTAQILITILLVFGLIVAVAGGIGWLIFSF